MARLINFSFKAPVPLESRRRINQQGDLLEKDPETGIETVLETGNSRAERKVSSVTRVSTLTQQGGHVLLMQPIDPEEALDLMVNSYFSFLNKEIRFDSLLTTQEVEECMARTYAMVLFADDIRSFLRYGGKLIQ